MATPLLQVNNLTVEFETEQGRMAAVKGVSFTIAPGELLAIVGESGSGKSITALSLLQLLPKQAHTKGELIFQKQNARAVNLLQLDDAAIRATRGASIAMIFQEPMTSLNPVFTCGYQVMEAIQLRQKVSKESARQKTIELFEQVQLPNPSQIIHRYPHELSGGQKQRVMIAMAMSCNPSLLIADEPTTALDVTVQKSILELIKSLQVQTGMSVILITHDLGLVADMADNIAVMYKGEIVEQGNASAVLREPRQAYTKALLNCRPSLHAKGERLPVVGDELIIDERALKNKNNPEINEDKVILAVEEVKVHYTGKKSWFGKQPAPYKAVDGVSFTVSKGETVGLVGESGCGKTTLGRAILQLVPVTSGKIILNGNDLIRLPKKELQTLRKDLQIVFQDPYGSLNPRITIGDAIMEPMQVHGILTGRQQRKEKVVELLEKVKLQPDHFNRYPHQFSGGQRQRICIARALALHPSFLIFDESVSALDVSVQAQVLNLLNDLKAEFGFTSIFISHDLSVVHYICDRMLVMQQGKIVESGAADQVYRHPAHPYTKKLVDAVPGKNLSS